MRGPHIQHDSAIDRLVDPQRPIPARATAIHGITDAMVAQANPFGAHWEVLADSMRDAVLVGHNIAFDIAHLRRAEIEWEPLPSLDPLLLATALEPRASGFPFTAATPRWATAG